LRDTLDVFVFDVVKVGEELAGVKGFMEGVVVNLARKGKGKGSRDAR
jgi:hypothetical protein